jgi:hypothetical protein
MRRLIEIPAANSRTSWRTPTSTPAICQRQPVCKAMECGSAHGSTQTQLVAARSISSDPYFSGATSQYFPIETELIRKLQTQT